MTKARPATRKFLLTGHICTSVALLGVAAAQTALGVVAFTAEPATARHTYATMFTLVHAVTVPTALLTGGFSLAISLLTSWGLVRHWWVVVKSLMFIAIVASSIAVLRPALLAGSVDGLPNPTVVTVPVLQVVVLVTASVLSTYKPWGRTPRGRVKQAEERAARSRRQADLVPGR